MKKKLVIFASGSGSNAINTCRYFKNHPQVEVAALFCNNSNAGVIPKMDEFGVKVVLFNRSTFSDPKQFQSLLLSYQPDWIALLGFLWKVPTFLVAAYPQKIINLHPALLPKFGGKGMYGHFVHEAVIAAKEKVTGITLHWINEQYDEGEIIAQYTCAVADSDTPETLAQKIHLLEQQHVPSTLEMAMQLE